MDRMAAIERVSEGLMLLREGSHNTRKACDELAGALELLDFNESNELTERERQVLEFVQNWDGERPPTFQKIADGCDLSSRAHARDIAIKLEIKGYATRTPGRARSIVIIKPAPAGVEDEERGSDLR